MSAFKRTTICFHLGTYKTATSFLQSVLWHTFGDPGGDVYYPRAGIYDNAHHYLATDRFPGWTNGVTRAEYEKAWNRLLEDVRASCASSVIISSEMFCSISSERIGYIREVLRDYPVRAIVYLRRQDQYISSLAAQLVKGCNGKPEYYTNLNSAIRFIRSSKQFDYENICAQWAGVIGEENLIVRPFEQGQFHEGDILKDFFHYLLERPVPGTAVLPTWNPNPRLCRDALEFKQLVNRLPTDRETKNATLPGLFAYSEAEDARTKSTYQEHVLLSPPQRLEILRRCADSNARIARVWLGREDGVLFKEAMPDVAAEWTPYPGVSRGTLEAIVHFLAEFPIYRAASAYDLDGFLQAAESDDLVRSYIWNSQVWCLASGPGFVECANDSLPPEKMFEQALKNIERLSFVGFTETFDDDARLIMRALNMNLVDMVRKDNVTKEKIAVADLPDRTIRLLEELTQWDRKLYDEIWRRRTDRLRAGKDIIPNHG